MVGQYFPVTVVNSPANQADSFPTSPSTPNVFQAIKNAANKTGVDFSYLLKKASQESGFDSTAKAATSSATGLFQFTSQTWLQMIKNSGAQYGLGNYASQISADSNGHLTVSNPAARQAILALRNDPQISAEMAGELDKQNAATLQQNVGGKIGGTELYLAHFLGAGGAGELIHAVRNNPTTTAASILPEAAAANQSVFYTKSGQPKTVAQIYNSFAQKFGGTSGTQFASSGHTASSPAALAANAKLLPTHVPANLAHLFASKSAVSGLNETTASIASYHSTNGAPVVSGSSTLFTAMVLGQMQNGNNSVEDSSLAAVEQMSDRRKNADSILASVA